MSSHPGSTWGGGERSAEHTVSLHSSNLLSVQHNFNMCHISIYFRVIFSVEAIFSFKPSAAELDSFSHPAAQPDGNKGGLFIYSHNLALVMLVHASAVHACTTWCRAHLECVSCAPVVLLKVTLKNLHTLLFIQTLTWNTHARAHTHKYLSTPDVSIQ